MAGFLAQKNLRTNEMKIDEEINHNELRNMRMLQTTIIDQQQRLTLLDNDVKTIEHEKQNVVNQIMVGEKRIIWLIIISLGYERREVSCFVGGGY